MNSTLIMTLKAIGGSSSSARSGANMKSVDRDRRNSVSGAARSN